MSKYVIGIVGGIASGKSFIANLIKENFSANVINADEIAHKHIETKYVQKRIFKRWGKKFNLNSFSGSAKEFRREIAKIIFNDVKERKFFEKMMMKLINKDIIKEIRELNGLIVLDMPLLFESKMQKYCNSIWFIDCHKDNRIHNFAKRYVDSGKPIADIVNDFKAREERQISCQDKLEQSTNVIQNDNLETDVLIRQIKDRIEENKIIEILKCCKDCKWCKKNPHSFLYKSLPIYWNCKHPNTYIDKTTYSPMTGETETKKESFLNYCSLLRSWTRYQNRSLCGPQGKWFELKKDAYEE